ncbi:extracellular solute-binding protein [Lysinibacillus sp. 3P01SB]|uniref:ABC transporter substrate-binding protein n=1 Tax=Lysinibacillus sp. 3P01SB TaxID=3132284 RepID=UPI0039A717FD
MIDKRRAVFCCFILLVIALTLLGCSYEKPSSGHTEKKEKVKLTFWFDNAGVHRTAVWEELIEMFEKEHPNIDIEYEGFLKDSAKAKFDAAIAIGEVPDVASIYTSWLPEYTSRDALLPLDAYFNSWSEKEKINPDTIAFNRSITNDRNVYGIPYTQNLDVFWVRADWLKNANLKTPETWDEFFYTVEKLTNKERNQYGYSIRGGAGSSFQLQRLMYAYSGISEYMVDGKSTINDPLHVEFVKKYFALYQNNTPISDITNDYPNMLMGFDNSTVGMIQHNIGSFAEHSESLAPDQFTVIPLPKSINGHYVVEDGNTMDISIFKQSKHPDEAWTFLSFLASQKAQSYWNKEVGQIPTHQEVFKEEWAINAPHLQTALQVYNDPQTKFYKPPFFVTEYNTIRMTIVEPGIQEVLSGTKTVEAFLEEWAATIEETYRRHEEYTANAKIQ